MKMDKSSGTRPLVHTPRTRLVASTSAYLAKGGGHSGGSICNSIRQLTEAQEEMLGGGLDQVGTLSRARSRDTRVVPSLYSLLVPPLHQRLDHLLLAS